MATPASGSDGGVVRITITEGHAAVLEPALPLLRPLFEYARRTFEPGGPLGYREVAEQMTLCRFDIRDRLWFAAGMVPRVLELLREHGRAARVEDLRAPGPRLRVDEGVLADCGGGMKRFLGAAAREPLGRVEAVGGADALGKMLLLGRLYPEARFVAAVATRKEAWRLWRALEDALQEKVGLATSGVGREGPRWLAGTFGSIPRRPGRYDVLLLPDAEGSTGTGVFDLVTGAGFRRVYAFVRPGRRPDRRADLRLEALAGPVIYRAKRPRVPVRVLTLPSPACPVPGYASPLGRKRALYWQNAARNEHVAAAAGAVTSGDRDALKELGLRDKDVRAVLRCGRAGVAVLVESPEHGRALLPLLPGWRLLALGDGGEAGGEEGQGGKRGDPGPAVVTWGYAANKGVRAGVVVRATGTGWALRIKGFPRTAGGHGPSEQVVLDFRDEFDAGARRDAEHRVEGYGREGIPVVALKRGPG